MRPASFLTASIRSDAEPVGMTLQLIAAADTGSGNFLVGLLLGICIGLLVGPAFRSWLVFREWTEASREAKLADRLLTRLETDAEGDTTLSSATDDGSRIPSRSEPRAPAAWRTPR
jgi:hypothetical protein